MKITEQQLNEEIAKRRGWTQSETLVGPGNVPVWLHPDEDESLEAPSYTGDMNLATSLLGELAYPSLSPCRHAESWRIYFDSQGLRPCREHKSPAVVICIAWLRWKTGETVEVE